MITIRGPARLDLIPLSIISVLSECSIEDGIDNL